MTFLTLQKGVENWESLRYSPDTSKNLSLPLIPWKEIDFSVPETAYILKTSRLFSRITDT